MAADTVFLDTNGWIALLSAADSLHDKAQEVWKELGREGCRAVLTDWIIAETGNGLARTAARDVFVRAARVTRTSPRARIVSVTDELLERALSLYADRPDKTWGLVDCASFSVMHREGITRAFTNDRHFAQAGFVCLLPPAP